MTDPVLLDGVARGIAAGTFAATAAAMAASRRLAPVRWVSVLFFVSAIAHVFDSAYGDAHPSLLAWGLSVTGTGLFWLFALGLFEDEPLLTPWKALPALVSLGIWLLTLVVSHEVAVWLWRGFGLMTLGLVGHVLLVAWHGWRDDLVDQRRRLRAPIAAMAAGYVLVQGICNFGLPGVGPVLNATLLQGLCLAVLGLMTAVALLRVEPVLVEAPRPVAEGGSSPKPETLDLSPADRLVLARLDRAMNEAEVWRGEDLSIGTLAALVGAPEHRLRKLINGVLGHRNFADYVNGRRIEAAKQALGDPELALKPVSTIAYELGFASLGPFNRAFRAATGATPTAWRQTAAAASPVHLRLVESGKRPPNSKTSA